MKIIKTCLVMMLAVGVCFSSGCTKSEPTVKPATQVSAQGQGADKTIVDVDPGYIAELS